MDLPTFRLAYPEFVTADDTVVTPALAMADRSVSSDNYDDKRDDVVGLTTAHILALSPFGRDARLSTATGESVYLVRLKLYKMSNGVRSRVA